MRAVTAIFLSFVITIYRGAGAAHAQDIRWSELEVYRPVVFDTEAVRRDDLRRSENGELELYGRTLPIDLRSNEHGRWSVEGNERVCRMRVRSAGALATELLFRDVVIPPGASLSFGSSVDPVLTDPTPWSLPPGVDTYASAMVLGDEAVLEYREPVDARFQGSFSIYGLVHAYRFVDDMEREGSCHVNVMCAPESNGWQDVINATVRISVVTPQGNGWCTGTLVNNVRQDCTPYILSAFHCGRTSTTAQFNQYKFYFNFQYATCAGGAYSTAQFLTGAQRVAYSDDYAPQYQGLGGSDFMLLRINSEIPDQFEPFWAGWDATNISSIPADGVCIHHPTGAPKRISSYTQTLTTGHPMTSSGLMSHYKAIWAATQNGHGITELGSSGAGLFKPNATVGPLLIGTLTGSSSGMTCTNNTGTAYFGKMSYHWTNNPNTTTLKLKPWLDPDATGTMVLGGSVSPCSTVIGVMDPAVPATLGVFPSPNDGSFKVVVPAGMHGRSELSVLDVSGRLVAGRTLSGGSDDRFINLGELDPGSYYLILQDDDQHAVTRIIIER